MSTLVTISDVTSQVSFDLNDDECLPITKCTCGAKFKSWEFFISVNDGGEYYSCPQCGSKFYWATHIKVFQVDKHEAVDE